MTQLFAMPCDTSADGFYFKGHEQFIEKSSALKNAYGSPVEEYEIQFINGDNAALFNALNINQATLAQWFEAFVDMDESEAAKAIYLTAYTGCDLGEILERMAEVMLFEGSALEYTEEFIEDTGMLNDMPENLRYYFDTEAFARDMLLGGDITEVEIDGARYIAEGC